MKSIKDFHGGDDLHALLCRIDKIRTAGSNFTFTLSDQSGEIAGRTAVRLYNDGEFEAFEGKTVMIDKGILIADKSGLYAKISTLSVAENVSPEAMKNLIKALPPEKVSEYIQVIQTYIAAVKTDGYRELLMLVFSNDNIKLMSTMPATHTRHCTYSGGMLEAIANVTRMCVAIGNHYECLGNGVYSSSVNWDLLLTGALLHLVGNLIYFESEPPHLKSSTGVNQGYASCEQNVILHYVYGEDLVMTDAQLSSLIGMVAQCNEYRAGVKSCCLEALILSGVYTMFGQMDMFDFAVDKLVKERDEKASKGKEPTSEYAFAEKGRMYTSEESLKRAQTEKGGNLHEHV